MRIKTGKILWAMQEVGDVTHHTPTANLRPASVPMGIDIVVKHRPILAFKELWAEIDHIDTRTAQDGEHFVEPRCRTRSYRAARQELGIDSLFTGYDYVEERNLSRGEKRLC